GLRLLVEGTALADVAYVDRDMWEKIVLNLVSNAFKFTFEGEITVAVRAAGRHAELTVRDTGIGIAAHDLPHLFERFHRIHGARSRTHEGSGIGLALVHELVRLHGGTISVESEPGHGTTFTVTVPLGTEHLPADRIGPARLPESTAVAAGPFLAEAVRWLPDEIEPDLAPIPDAGVAAPDARVLLAD